MPHFIPEPDELKMRRLADRIEAAADVILELPDNGFDQFLTSDEKELLLWALRLYALPNA